MAIKMTLGTLVIPVEIGNFKFEMNIADEQWGAFQEKAMERAQQLEALSKSDDEPSCYSLLEELVDELLGRGAFGKLYEYTPNLQILYDVVSALVVALEEKIQSRLASQVALKCVYQKDSIFTR